MRREGRWRDGVPRMNVKGEVTDSDLDDATPQSESDPSPYSSNHHVPRVEIVLYNLQYFVNPSNKLGAHKIQGEEVKTEIDDQKDALLDACVKVPHMITGIRMMLTESLMRAMMAKKAQQRILALRREVMMRATRG